MATFSPGSTMYPTHVFVFSTLLLLTHTMNVEDLQALFGTQHCIEASLVSIPALHSDPVMFDAASTQEAQLLNKTLSGKTATATIHELAQYNGLQLIYKLIKEEGPAHAKSYTVRLTLGHESYEDTGPSLKKAKELAAALALENTLYEHPPEKLKVNEGAQTPTVILNNVAIKLGIAVSYHLLTGQQEHQIDSYGSHDNAFGGSKSWYPKINATFDPLKIPVEDPQLSGPFTVKAVVGDLVVKGMGHTIQAARHDAALNALRHLEKEALLKDDVCSREETTEACREKKERLKSPITRVHEAAQRHNLPVAFDIIDEDGKSHQKVFTTQCVLGEFVTQAQGHSKKESKRVAAEKMLKHLPNLPKYGEFDEVVITKKSKKKKQKKKNKIVRETVGSTIDGVSSVLSSIWSGNEDTVVPKVQPAQRKSGTTPKDRILQIGAKLNIAVEFMDLGKQDNEFVSLMALGVHPPHMCLGKASTRDTSHDVVASHGLKFLQKSGIHDKVQLTQEEQSGQLDREFEEESLYEPFNEVEEK